jgi:hypothetical protein
MKTTDELIKEPVLNRFEQQYLQEYKTPKFNEQTFLDTVAKLGMDCPLAYACLREIRNSNLNIYQGMSLLIEEYAARDKIKTRQINDLIKTQPFIIGKI